MEARAVESKDAKFQAVRDERPAIGGALRDYWHPVAQSSEVGDKPVSVRLLDVPLVLWRSDDALAAFYDLCIHRGTALSLGRVADGELICAYHGWQYSSTGKCTRIPSLPPERGIPGKARATAYRVAERYGLIWVCLGDPVSEIPGFPPELADPGFRWASASSHLQANAARFMENGMDQSHFAFVHPGKIAIDPEVAPIEIIHTDDGFTYEVENPLNTLKSDGPRERTRYRVILPFTLFLEKFAPAGMERLLLLFVGSPVTSNEAKVFRFQGINFRRYSDEDERVRERTIFEQDRAVVESQRPEELPLDLREELHLRGPDSAGLEYRKALGRLGVHWG